MDELRDYRFYNSDMIHPNKVAIDYIWDKFKHVWLSEESLKTLDLVAAIQAKKAHRPFNSSSEVHQQFLTKLESEIVDLQSIYPHIKF